MANKTKNRLREKYSQVANSIPRNYNLSFQAIGFYTLLNSLPDGWEFTYAGIMAIRRNPNDPQSKPKESEKVLQKLVKELTLAGALVRVRAVFVNDTVGGYGGFDWIINPDAEDIELARSQDPILINLKEKVTIKGVEVGGMVKYKNKSEQKIIKENQQPPKQDTKEQPKPTEKQRFVSYVIENTKKLYPSLDVELFTAYLSEKKGKTTQRAGDIILNTIKECINSGSDVNKMIEKAYEGNYQTLHVPKTFKGKKSNSQRKCQNSEGQIRIIKEYIAKNMDLEELRCLGYDIDPYINQQQKNTNYVDVEVI